MSSAIPATPRRLEDVYWRNMIRDMNAQLHDACKDASYRIITNKNILWGDKRMAEAYVHLCTPSLGLTSALNVRVVQGSAASTHVRCKETYANETRTVDRWYPFSLKWVSTDTFDAKSKVIRKPADACTWLHITDVLESKWF